jgi:hypothetical protein
LDLAIEQPNIGMVIVGVIALVLLLAVVIGVFRRTCSIVMGLISTLVIFAVVIVIILNGDIILAWLQDLPFWPQ